MLEEVLSEVVISDHRILVEQRATQRFCRCCKCCKKTPNIRATYLAHYRAASYVTDKKIRSVLPNKIRVDFIIKLCPSGERFYPPGLMLRQMPYQVQTKENFGKDKPWLHSIFTLYDAMTSSKDYIETDSRDEDDDSDSDDYANAEIEDVKLNKEFLRLKGKKGKKAQKGKSGTVGKGKGAAEKQELLVEQAPQKESTTESKKESTTESKKESRTRRNKELKTRQKEEPIEIEAGKTEEVHEQEEIPKKRVMRAARDSDSDEHGMLGSLGFVFGSDSSEDDDKPRTARARRAQRRDRRGARR